jgi:GNAT superfamily N-acetyltransferase
MKIRDYGEGDFDGIRKVVDRVDQTYVWPVCHPKGWDEARIREEFDPIWGYKDPLFLVAEYRSQIVGLIAGHDLVTFIEQEIPHLKDQFLARNQFNKGVYYQRDIIVTPESWGKEVAFSLFDGLRRKTVRRGYKKIVTRTFPINERGVRFFERLGFQSMFTDDNPERVYFEIDL